MSICAVCLHNDSIVAYLTTQVVCKVMHVCVLFQMISLLPARVIRLLEFIGFSGSKVSSLYWEIYFMNDVL
jgi:hypothetical protein